MLVFASRFHPNTISAMGTVFAVLAAAMLVDAPTRPWMLLLVPLMLFLRIACNALDGMVAVRRDMQSATGEMVNEFSDRLNDTVILAGLALSGLAPAAITLAALVAVLLVSYLGILPRAAGGERNYDGPMGKADRMLVLGAACIVGFIEPSGVSANAALTFAAALIFAGAVVTIVRRWIRSWRALEAA